MCTFGFQLELWKLCLGLGWNLRRVLKQVRTWERNRQRPEHWPCVQSLFCSVYGLTIYSSFVQSQKGTCSPSRNSTWSNTGGSRGWVASPRKAERCISETCQFRPIPRKSSDPALKVSTKWRMSLLFFTDPETTEFIGGGCVRLLIHHVRSTYIHTWALNRSANPQCNIDAFDDKHNIEKCIHRCGRCDLGVRFMNISVIRGDVLLTLMRWSESCAARGPYPSCWCPLPEHIDEASVLHPGKWYDWGWASAAKARVCVQISKVNFLVVFPCNLQFHTGTPQRLWAAPFPVFFCRNAIVSLSRAESGRMKKCGATLVLNSFASLRIFSAKFIVSTWRKFSILLRTHVQVVIVWRNSGCSQCVVTIHCET